MRRFLRFRSRRSRPIDPPWSDAGESTRVLVEHPDPAAQWAMERVLREVGYEVAACDGPCPDTSCSLIAEGRCVLVDTADVVVNGLGLRDGAARNVAFHTKRVYPETPVLLAATSSEVQAHPELAEGVEILRATFRGSDLVAGVDRASGRANRRRGLRVSRLDVAEHETGLSAARFREPGTRNEVGRVSDAAAGA